VVRKDQRQYYNTPWELGRMINSISFIGNCCIWINRDNDNKRKEACLL
jgi:hypothetical protein